MDDNNLLEKDKAVSMQEFVVPKVFLYVYSTENVISALSEWNIVNVQEEPDGVMVLTISVHDSEKEHLNGVLGDLSTDGIVYGSKSFYLGDEYPEEFNVEVSLTPVDLLKE